MPRRVDNAVVKKILLAVGLTAVGIIALAGSVWVCVSLGLDSANKLAGVLGLFVAAGALAVTAYGVVLTRKSVIAQREARRQTGGGQHVTNSTVGGGVIQTSGVGGNVTIGHGQPAAEPPKPPAQQPTAPASPSPVQPAHAAEPSAGQHVTGSHVTGNVDQVSDVDGSVNIER